MKIRRGENIIIDNDVQRDQFLITMEKNGYRWANGEYPTEFKPYIDYPYDIKLQEDGTLYMGDNYIGNNPLMINTISFEVFNSRSNYTLYKNNDNFPGYRERDLIILTNGINGLILEGVKRNVYFNDVWDNFDYSYFHILEEPISIKSECNLTFNGSKSPIQDMVMYRNEKGEVIISNEVYTNGVILRESGMEYIDNVSDYLEEDDVWGDIDEIVFNNKKLVT